MTMANKSAIKATLQKSTNYENQSSSEHPRFGRLKLEVNL